MLAKFDSYRKFETPMLYVCSPGCVYRNGMLTNTSGILLDTSDIEIIPTFNATSKLNFRCYKVRRKDSEEDAHTMRLYRSLRNRKLIYADGIGFFVITSVVDGYADHIAYKDIAAESCEVELRTKDLPYIENGTYKFYTGEAGNPGMIERLMAYAPLWTLGNIDITVVNRYRTFEDVDFSKNILGFMLEDLQDAYECLFVFDIVNRVVNIYDKANYVHETDIHLTKDDLMTSINITESSDDLYTALRVTGDEELSINAVNPLGTGVIYNFNYYLDWMTDTLGEKVRTWQALVNSYKDSYYNLQLSRYANLTTKSGIDAELDRLNTQLTMYTRCRENIVAEASDEDIAAYNAVIVQVGGVPIPENQGYLWVMYADDSHGTNITANPYGKRYIGLAYDKSTQVASNNPSDYSWYTFRNGETFPRTVDGQTKYTWIVFADSIVSGMSNDPDEKAYIGVALDKSSATKSTDYKDYSWSLIESGGIGLNETLATILSLIEDTETEIAAAQAQKTALEAIIADQDSQVSAIHNAVAMDSYFTDEDMDELSNYIVEGTYTDEYVTVTESMTYSERFAQMKTLYDRSVDQLERIAYPTQEFSLDVENFIFIKEFERWSEQLETGCLINVEVDDNDVAALFLTSFEVNYEDKKLTMTFGNRYNRFDSKALFDKVLGSVSRTANTLAYVKNTIYPIESGEFNKMKEALETSRTLTKNAVLSSENEQVIIDDTGYTGRRKLPDGTIDPKQIKINGRNIVFTDDAWETCRTAIGELILSGGASAYGINAEVLLGNIIMGNELHIINANGEDMFQVTEDNVMIRVGEEYAKQEDTISGVDVMYCRASSSSVCDATTITVPWSTTAPAWVNGEYIWQKTITTYDDGTPVESTPTCISGAAGESAYTITLTNNNHTFAATEDAAIASNVDCNVIAYKGSTQVAATIGSITGAPTGMTTTISNNSTTSAKFNVAVTTSMTTQNGTLTVPVTVDGKTFNMVFTYSLALKGEDGANATSYSLIVSHAAVGKAEDGTYNPSAITLTGKSQTGTGAMSNYAGRFKIETTADNTTWTTAYTSSSNEATKSYTVPADIIAIRCSLYLAGDTTTLLDQQTVPIVSDGATGTDGAPGEDAYTVILTNENHTFAGGTSAAIASNVDCNVIAYKGSTQVAATIGSITGAPTGMTTTISNNSTTSAKFNVAVTTSMTTQNGTLTVPVTVDGKTFNMVFTYSLALDGVGVSSASITYALSNDGSTPPALESDWGNLPASIPEGEYLWTRTITTYTDNSQSTSYSVSRNGTNGDGVGIKGSSVTYTISDDGSTPPATGWTDVFPGEPTDGHYLWTRTVTTYTDDTVSTSYSVSSSGVGISNIVEEYYLSSSDSDQVDGEWSTTPPVWTSGKYIWTRSHIYWNNNTDTTTTPVLNETYNYIGASLDNCVTEININKAGIEQNTQYYQELYGQVAKINAYIQTGVVSVDEDGKTSFGVKIGENLSSIDAYIVSGATAFSAGWLSDTVGGAAITPVEDVLYQVKNTGAYYNKTYRWNGTAYTEAGSEGTLSSVFTSSELGFYDTGEKTAYFSNKNLNVRTVRTGKILLSPDVISDTSTNNWQIGIDNGFYIKWIGA